MKLITYNLKIMTFQDFMYGHLTIKINGLMNTVGTLELACTEVKSCVKITTTKS